MREGETSTTTEPQDEVLTALIEAFETQPDGDTDEFCNWYLRTLEEAKAADKKLDEMYQLMKREIHYRRQALQYVKGPVFMQKVKLILAAQPGTAKSVKFLMGRSGYRSSRESITFQDEEAAKKWAYANCSADDLTLAVASIKRTPVIMAALKKLKEAEFIEAIGGLNETPFHDSVKKDGELPDGVELKPAEDKFYPWIDNLALPVAETKLELEGGKSSE